MLWSPHKKVSFDLEGIDTTILKGEELAGLDGHFKELEVAVQHRDVEFSLYARSGMFGPGIELYGPRDAPYDIVDSFAIGVAKIVKGKVEEGKKLVRNNKLQLKVIDLQVPREKWNPPFPLANIADYMVGYKGLGEIQAATAHYQDVPKGTYSTAHKALGEASQRLNFVR